VLFAETKAISAPERDFKEVLQLLRSGVESFTVWHCQALHKTKKFC
jgi:G:T-mismatch repair DNA endonuclease (very short patch repair protein)